jgi:hypothetical protein
MALFLPSAVLCVASALTGIQSFDYDSRIGITIIYWRGYWRVQKIICGVDVISDALPFGGVWYD